MVWFKRGAWALLALVGAVALALSIYIARAQAPLDGVLQAKGLHQQVSVQRDAADVTHIQAQSPQDAWFALGLVHAQERGWQLELNRRVMHGQLSEIFGEATLDTDKLMRTLGIVRAAQRQLQGLPAEAKAALQAYSQGVNTGLQQSAQALSPEFHLLQVRPGRWEPVDSVGWALMMALDLGGNWGTEFARLVAAKHLNQVQLGQLLQPYPGEDMASSRDLPATYAELGVYRKDAPTAATSPDSRLGAAPSALAQWSQDWATNVGNVEGKGSNNWVVAGTHTQSGKPLLANDPHLGLGAPAIWYFARLQAPGLDVIGATLPGLPFVVLGRTANVAWGFTNTGPDVQDLYLEQIHPSNPGQYRLPDVDGQAAWADFETQQETIAVKGKPAVQWLVRSTRHGPVISDAQKHYRQVVDTSRYAVALRWSALDADNHTVQAGLQGNRAQSVDALLEAYANYHSPMQNVVMADTSGKIAYKAVGKVPLRKPGNDIMGLAPAPGWDARYDWSGWLDFAQTPQDDGAKGWVATANQRITPPDYPHFLGQDWALPYRFERIEQLLAQTPRHDLASMQAIHGDVTSLATQKLLPVLAKVQSQHALAAAAVQQLRNFDGVMRADSAAPLIFAAWADELARGLITPKIGAQAMDMVYGKRHFRLAVEGMLARNDDFWCAGNCAVQANAAMDRALDRLQRDYGSNVAAWNWGQAHEARSTHTPFDKVAALAPLFNVTVPTGGDPYTVNVGQHWLQDARPFANRHAASLRAVYDLSNLENSRFVYQTGQSGLVFSARYRDMRGPWAQVEYRPLQMQPSEIRHSLTLKP